LKDALRVETAKPSVRCILLDSDTNLLKPLEDGRLFVLDVSTDVSESGDACLFTLAYVRMCSMVINSPEHSYNTSYKDRLLENVPRLRTNIK
jgi:hypothetical protein